MKYIYAAAVIIVSLVSCGIEDYPYIYSIPTGNVQNELNSRVSIFIPDSNSGNLYFTNFTVFYRIYISDRDFPSPSESDFSQINPSLYSDHSRVRGYIGNDSMGSSTISTLFQNTIKYYTLSLEGTEIDHFLSDRNQVGSPPSNIFNKYLIIDFSRGESGLDTIPYMVIADLNSGELSPRYNLLRYNGAGVYEPKPDNLYFDNTSDLLAEENVSNEGINNDVTDKSNSERKYTYVNMYILASGIDPSTFTQLYSSPTHIGVLKLPDIF